MIFGEIAVQLDGTYKINLNNGQFFSLEEKDIPEALRVDKKRISLIFGGNEEGSVNSEEARLLINNLLSFN